LVGEDGGLIAGHARILAAFPSLAARAPAAKVGDGQVVLISGEAGIGKSRIAAELEGRLQFEPHLLLRHFCSPYHQDSALYPFVHQLGRAAGVRAAEDRRYDQSEYEPFWAAAAALDLPLSLHTATRRQGKIRGAGPGTLRDASSRATKAFYPALSMCDLIFSGVFERHPRLTLAIVEFELAWAVRLGD
jgi:predicted TIM-barrel fold metal-dependent hydrolase